MEMIHWTTTIEIVQPNRKTFERLDRRLKKNRAIYPKKINCEKVSHRRTPRNAKAVLISLIENNPGVNIRRMALNCCTSVWRILK